MLRATRPAGGVLAPNILWNYGHTTIPRHLRDVVITEYGVADLRGRTDAECIAAMIDIADSRFQEELLRAAKRANKIDAGYRIPAARRHNTPGRLAEAFGAARGAGLFSEYPFGTDLTREEIELARALRWLKDSTAGTARKLALMARAAVTRSRPAERACLQRLRLDVPRGTRERLLAGLVALALRATSPEQQTTSRTAATDP
jgi:hypothetical protein